MAIQLSVSLNVDGVLLPSPLVTAALSPGSISSLSFTSSLHGGEQPDCSWCAQ